MELTLYTSKMVVLSLLKHLTVLLQMISTLRHGFVNILRGESSLYSKKNEKRPINAYLSVVSTRKCKLYELLFTKELQVKCYTPPLQFGVQHGIVCVDAHTVVDNALLDASWQVMIFAMRC